MESKSKLLSATEQQVLNEENENEPEDDDEDIKIPLSFRCPILQTLMKDPVMDPEGNSYERSAILDWLKGHSRSPLTNSPLSSEQLLPNRALQSSIEQFVHNNQNKKGKAKNDNSNSSKDDAKKKEKEEQKQDNKNQQQQQEDGMHVDAVVDEKKNLWLTVKMPPDDGKQRTPSDICCVIDVSDSMGSEVSIKNGSGQSESHGLSQLDLVKHAVRMVMNSLNASDRLALVAFGDKAVTVLPLTSMSMSGKKEAQTALDALEASGNTNLWAGLHTGLELLRKAAARNGALLLLTDGQPTVEPPRGHLAVLQHYLKTVNVPAAVVHTFGFGYDLDSRLLSDLAAETQGSFAFIPDASMVGTIFVNALANVLTIAARHVTLEVSKDAEDQKKLVLHLGTLHFGQDRHVVISSEYMTATLKLADSTVWSRKLPLVADSSSKSSRLQQVIRQQTLRVDVVRLLCHLPALMDKGQQKEAVARIEQQVAIMSKAQDDLLLLPYVQGLVADLRGQVMEACGRPDWYTRWGRHYLPSLTLAHAKEICNNFKDPGVQMYGGASFRVIRDQLDAVFCALPPPKPVWTTTASNSGGSSSQKNKLSSMSSYHNSGNACFHGACTVAMARNGEEKRVDQLQKGDCVFSPGHEGGAQVVCLVKSRSNKMMAVAAATRTGLIHLPGGLRITPYHPVRVKGKDHFAFPCTLAEAIEEQQQQRVDDDDAVYSLVLAPGHSLIRINGIDCVTLGHGIHHDPVAAHPFFGTEAVLEDLKRGDPQGYQDGRVTISGRVMRDSSTGLVCSLFG